MCCSRSRHISLTQREALKTRMVQVAPRSPANPSPPVSLGAAADPCLVRYRSRGAAADRDDGSAAVSLGAAAWGESSLLPTPPRPSQLAGAAADPSTSSLSHPAPPAAPLSQSPSASSPSTHASAAAGDGAGEAEAGAGRHSGGLRLGQAVADMAELERLAAAWRQVCCLALHDVSSAVSCPRCVLLSSSPAC